MDKPKISVVTVCYNAVDTLERTMLSVLNQTYTNIEYIVIDGASTDGTVDIIKKYADRLAYWVSEPDKGIYDAMNKGIKAATGEWINFMNSGDVFADNNTLKTFASNIDEGIRILRGNIMRIYKKFKVKSVGVTSQTPGLIDMFDNTFHHQACLIQRSLFEEFGYYSLDYRLISDWKFFFDCVVLHHVKSKYVDITVALFQMDGATSVNTLKNKEEQTHYLKSLYGEELYEILVEATAYRKVGLIRKYYKVREHFLNSLSPKMFNNLLTFKRCLWQCLGMKVN